jgi:hypothetical protein
VSEAVAHELQSIREEKEKTMPWQTLSDTTSAVTQILLHPAGGMELRRLTIERAEGYCVTLTIDEVDALRRLLTGPGSTPQAS